MVERWLNKWRTSLAYCSENQGCGCCVDLFDVEAPEEALAELPAFLLADSDWVGKHG